MPKLFKSKMFLFTLFVVMIGSISSIKEQLRERELRQYVQWKPRPVIKDYEFINNGEALVIEWDDGDERELIVFNVVQIVSNLVIWGLIAPVGDVLIYKESANKVFLQGVVAGSLNALTVAVAGSLLLIAYARTQTKDGSLTKD